MLENVEPKIVTAAGPLGIIAVEGCEEFAKLVDKKIRQERVKYLEEKHLDPPDDLFIRDSYMIDTEFVRFGTGEGKCVLHNSVRDYDIYIVVDVFNYGVTYKAYGQTFHKSPDDHFADLKRAIVACCGKAQRISVIMPMLYEGRQHKRSMRESLDCATALQELCDYMGVENIITFDAHDPRVQNAIPLKGFENVQTTYQMIKSLVKWGQKEGNEPIKIDKDHLMVISPDEGGVHRCIYYSEVLGVDLGMFYKRRDYSVVVDGSNPVIAHEFLGSELKGKDVIVVDDMISTGGSVFDVARELKKRGAGRIFVCAAFGLFCKGLKCFDDAYEEGIIDCVLTSNLIYQPEELFTKKWYQGVDETKFVALLISTLNRSASLSNLLDPSDKIYNFLHDLNGYDVPNLRESKE